MDADYNNEYTVNLEVNDNVEDKFSRIKNDKSIKGILYKIFIFYPGLTILSLLATMCVIFGGFLIAVIFGVSVLVIGTGIAIYLIFLWIAENITLISQIFKKAFKYRDS